jgi:hypothetical protein
VILQIDNIVRALTVATTCALLSACAGVVHKPLSDTSRNNIRSVEMRVVVLQEGPIFSARPPGVATAAGGGLIPALIDASVQKSRQESLVSKVHSVLEAVHDYDFREEYSSSLNSILGDGFPLKVGTLSVVPSSLSREAADAAIAATKGGTGLLLLISYYELEPNLSALTIRTSASLWSEGNPQKAYSNHLIFQATSGSLDLDRNTELWASENGQRLREQSLLGIRETLKMLVLDIGMKEVVGKPNSPSSNTPTEKFSFYMAGLPQQLEGILLASEPGRALVRDKAGALFSLPR